MNNKISQFALLTICFALPNLILFIAANHTGLVRPLINVDYAIWALLFLYIPTLISIPLLVGLFFVDIISILGQLFPIFRMEDALYLLGFIHLAPTFYKISIAMLVVALIAIIIIFIKSKKIIGKEIWLVSINIMVAAYIAHIFIFPNTENERIWRVKTMDLIDSQLIYNIDSRGDGFVLGYKVEGTPFKPSPYNRASNKLLSNEFRNNKLLLIVAESWGSSPHEVTQLLIAPLLELASESTHIEYGETSFLGATVAAEFKELCNLLPLHFNMKSVSTELNECLPHLLAAQGYSTKAMHGASGTMYDRAFWYPKAGFHETHFLESKARSKRCYSFPGACDVELFSEVENFFVSHEKGFFYWLTLNSHVPFDERDIHNHSFDCSKLNVSEQSPTCNYFKLHAQFFYSLAELLKKPAMQGIEILVVGDHMPGIFNKEERERLFKQAYVSWIKISN